MADNWTQSVACRYFKNGMCREGNSCRYRHINAGRPEVSSNEAQSSTRPSSYNVPCFFFKHGTCKFGEQCHYLHIIETTGNTSTRQNQSESSSSSQSTNEREIKPKQSKSNEEDKEKNWANAPEFVPSVPNFAASSSSAKEMPNTSATDTNAKKPSSYAEAVNTSSGQAANPASAPICPYAENSGVCRILNCSYIHGDICDLCNRPALHPYNEELRKKHTSACVKQHEVNMERSFAIARSRNKSCGVCFETIMEKTSREQRFGILPNCNHCFCLTCIRKWRQAKQYDNKIIRACPECRITSDFVCPSMYWVETKEDKQKLIEDYKGALSTKDCKYFNKGRGKCPFGNKCFYLHALPDGTKTDVGPPVRQRRNADSDMDILHDLQQMILRDFLEERQDRWMHINYEDISPFLADSDESDFSDYEFPIWD